MSIPKALLAALPLAVAGAGLAYASTTRIAELRAEVARLDAEGRTQGDAFVATLSRADAERELATLDRRKAAALALAGARRNRLLGVVLLVAAPLAGAAVRVAQRVAAEVEDDRRLLGGPAARGRGG
ncbi:MAG: hypothetical protein ACJ79R_03465 [Anaeromyxobacteraceae bacterium]